MRVPRIDPAGFLDFHRFLLGNTNERLSIYQRALAGCVAPGATVLDLGCGSGALAFLACLAGASRVYAIEKEPSRELARVLARANGFDDRVMLFDGQSGHVQLPERVDVIVSDTYDTFGLEEHGLQAIVDARRRFLKPGGTMMPNAIELILAPVASSELYDAHVDFWQRTVLGIDVSAVRDIATNTRHTVRLNPEMFLGAPARIARLDLMGIEDGGVQGQATLRILRRGTLHGFGGWFIAALTGALTVSNDPAASTTNYAQTFFPLARPVEVAPGDLVALTLASYDNRHWRWQAELHGVTFDRSNFLGFLPTETDPSHK